MEYQRIAASSTIAAVAAGLALTPAGAQGAQPGRNGQLAVYSAVENGDRGDPAPGFSGIELVRPNGRGRRLLCECAGSFDLAFSPDGSKLALDGVSVVRVGQSPATPRKTGLGNFNLSVAWSPDGNRLLYSDPRGQTQPWALFIGNPDGTGVRQVTDDADDQVGDWSSRGLIVFDRTVRNGGLERNPSDLYLMRPDGTRLRRLVKKGRGGDFAPKGGRVAFERSGVVYSVGIDGKGLRRLGRGEDPAWSPDGKRIAFIRDASLWTMDTKGKRRRLVMRPRTEPDFFEANKYLKSPSWQPLR